MSTTPYVLMEKNVCCGFSLEMPYCSTSNEYPQCMFWWRNKKNTNVFCCYPLLSGAIIIV